MKWLVVIGVLVSGAVFGQANDEEKSKPAKHWVRLPPDTATTEQGNKEIIKIRRRYMRREHGWIVETVTQTYDKCDKLISKQKMRLDQKCFRTGARIIYDRNYKSDCENLTTETIK